MVLLRRDVIFFRSLFGEVVSIRLELVAVPGYGKCLDVVL